MAPPPFATMSELAMCQCCSRRTAVGQYRLCVNATAEALQKRTEIMEKWWQQQQVQVKESRWVEEIRQKWKQPKGEDRTEMKKEAKLLSCTLLDGSAWSTERKYMRRCKGKCDIFFGVEHRLRRRKWRISSTKRPRKDGGLQRTRRESQMRMHTVKITSTRQ